jgi:probable O-glycosylation ligase (exosortase A-associated)
MRPQDLDAWGFWNGKPVFQLAIAILLLGNLIHQNIKLKLNGFIVLALLFYFWIILSALFSVFPAISWGRYQSHYMTLGPSLLLVFFTINSLDNIKMSLLAMGGSIGLLAAKVGLGNAISGGSRITDQIDGFIGDNNCFGLSICLALGIMLGMRTMIENKLYRRILDVIILLSILTILFTQSRGAFLTIAIIFFFGIINSRKPVLTFIVVASVVFTGYLVLPKNMFERLNTLENVEKDPSAMHRFEMWQNAFTYANEYPVFGVGIGGYRQFNKVRCPNTLALVTHSTYFQVLSEMGYVGLSIYLLILIYTLWVLHWTFKHARKHYSEKPEYKWIAETAFWIRNAMIGYIFGSAFLDMLAFDIPWYTMLYSSLLAMLYKQKLQQPDSETSIRDDNGMVNSHSIHQETSCSIQQ